MTSREVYFQLNNGQVVDIKDAAQAVQANEVDRLIGALSLVVLIPMLKNRHHLSSDMDRRRLPTMSRRWRSGVVSNSCFRVGEDEVTADG